VLHHNVLNLGLHSRLIQSLSQAMKQVHLSMLKKSSVSHTTPLYFTLPEVSLRSSHETAIGPCLQPEKSSLYHFILLLYRPF